MSQDVLESPDLHPRPQSASLRPRLLLARLRASLGVGVHVALWGWAFDVLRIVSNGAGSLPASELTRGLICALFRAFLLTLLPALLIGVASWLSELQRQWSRKPPFLRLMAAHLREGSPREQLAKAGVWVALGPLAALTLLAAVLICERLITGMARPQFAAMACVASCSVLLLMAALLLPAASAAGSMLCAALSRLTGGFLSRTWQFALLVLLLAAAVLATVVYRFRTALGYLPWPMLLQLMAAVALGFASAWLAARLPRWTRPSRLIIGVLLVAVATSVAALQRPAAQSRQVSERDSVIGHLGQAVLLAAWDGDGDGYLPSFGGGDCAPREAGRNPGATEIPGNGVDEDCDGEDLDPKATALRGKLDYPVREDVPPRLPIVLITVDAFAASHMRALGYPRDLTPNIDALAQRSVFFRQCFAQGPSTRLSFPSIFTSRWDTQIEQELVGHHPFPIGKHEKLLAEVLQGAGYETTAILSDGYFSPRFWRGITRGFAHIDESPFMAQPHLDHNGERVTNAAITALKQSHEKPLFLWVHYYDAHSPHQQPADIPVFGESRQDVYDAELNLVDHEVGKLLQAIEEQWHGQALVLLTGDHGIAFDEPRHAKFNYGYDLYTSVLHVPLVVHAPFLPPRQLDSVVSTMDIAPTLANLLRLRGPLPYEGVSLVPELFTGKVSRPPELMHQMFIEERKWKKEEPLERVSLRTDRFDLLHDRKTGFFELYDYRKDYWETRDLANDPDFSATLQQLRKQLTMLLFNAQPPQPAAANQPRADR